MDHENNEIIKNADSLWSINFNVGNSNKVFFTSESDAEINFFEIWINMKFRKTSSDFDSFLKVCSKVFYICRNA